jgi:hypothetical protein
VNLLTLASVALAACQAPVPASAADQSKVEVRVYDLSSLADWTSSSELNDTVWPVLVNQQELDTGWDIGMNLDEEAPATLLRSLFPRDFEIEGNLVESQGQGRFTVRGPASLHERISKALPQLMASVGARLELEVDFVRLAQPPAANAALLPESQASALVDAAQKEGRVARRRFTLSSGRPETFVQGRWLDVVADYNVEVAQGSFAFDPYPLRAQLGTRMAVRAAPGAGGVFLALNLRRASALGKLTDRFLARSSRIANENASRTEQPDVLHQRLPILDQGYGLNSFLPDGQALAIVSSQGGADVHELILVRRVGGGLQRTARVEAEGGSAVLLIDTTAWAPPYASSSWEETMWLQAPYDPYYEGGVVTISLAGPCDRGLNVEDVLYNNTMGGERPIENLEQHWPWLLLPQQGDAPLPDIEGELKALAPDQRLVQVSLTLRAQGAKLPISSMSLALRAGLASSVLLGVEDTYVGDFDVEIAQNSSVEDPVLRSLFDGVKLELLPRIELDGSLTLRLQGQASAREADPTKHQLGGGTIGEVETAAQSYLILNETLRWRAGDRSSSLRAVIGDLEGGLTLEVEAKP